MNTQLEEEQSVEIENLEAEIKELEEDNKKLKEELIIIRNVGAFYLKETSMLRQRVGELLNAE